MKVAFQIDQIETLDFNSDSSLCIANEALKREFDVWFYTPETLTYKKNKLYAIAQKISAITDIKVIHDQDKEIILNDIDVLFIRQNPPFDMKYITYTYLLDLLTDTLVINKPSSIRNFTEKLATLLCSELTIDTMVTTNVEEALNFLTLHKEIVCKPLYEFGGRDITKYNESESNIFHNKFQALAKKYNTPLILQKFIPEVNKGDKRIILVNGKPVGAIKRIPKEGSIKSNLCAGGTAEKTTLTKQDTHIATEVGKILKKHDILFAGIDVIGEYLTEINVTSPTGIIPINKLDDLQDNHRIESLIWQAILKTTKTLPNKQK